MLRAGAGNTAGNNLRAFGNEFAKTDYVFIVDFAELSVYTELANLLAARAGTAGAVVVAASFSSVASFCSFSGGSFVFYIFHYENTP